MCRILLRFFFFLLENVEGVKKTGPAACQAPSVNQRSGQTSSLISCSLNIPGYLLMAVKC